VHIAAEIDGVSDMKNEESIWMSSVAGIRAVSVRVSHVFFSSIRFTSLISPDSAVESTPPALRISRGGCGVVLIDCIASSPASAAIVCHLRPQSFGDHRSATPAYFADARSNAGSPVQNLINSGRSSSSTRSNTPNIIGSSPSHFENSVLNEMITLVGWRCTIRHSQQGLGCVRARCMMLQCTFNNCERSACEVHGRGARLQLLRCKLRLCNDSMLVCNSSAWLRVASSLFETCSSVARCCDQGSIAMFGCAVEKINNSIVTVTQESSLFCINCSLKDVGLECENSFTSFKVTITKLCQVFHCYLQRRRWRQQLVAGHGILQVKRSISREVWDATRSESYIQLQVDDSTGL
jgi:hypothetical protein